MTKALPITLGTLTDKNINLLKRLNSAIFPVKYSNEFYQELLRDIDLTRFAFYGYDILVGAVTCQKNVINDTTQELYIMTLGVLAPYRRGGVGKVLLEWVLNELAPKHPQVKRVYLHVQEGNDEAFAFYQSFGFSVGDVVPDYYQKIQPSSARVVFK
eukprot:CAMPEP_0184351578 /NCGR_PEP_ID=MMETSP1089-20130417/43725_1 /TAXON_ID=38269 ORGANISM="Gloeochaete wittrockiana, Strain SAG46.84" /NCGR_SAMPLE_ID=MMETSP1089 /ASSEMBLY_ACC=CAM_ASM_000445 /LENGTH=156 /DNA_ID=CAMNT_0026684983 /DNA_START=1 /DNA_END=468 /DNA_ORIENTATION=+